MATTAATYGKLSIPEQALAEGEDRAFVRVRADLDIGAFGVNAVYQAKAGERLIGEHDEVGPGADGQEELYVVLQGDATFTIDGKEVDAPHGTAIFVRDPATKRGAVAASDGAIVLAVGGRRGEAYRVPPEGTLRGFFKLYEAGDYEGALAICRQGLELYPGNALILYDLACCESLLGRSDDALATLERSLAAWPAYKELARDDDDFAPLRDDPRFRALVG